MNTNFIQTLATDWAERDIGTKVATCRHTPLRDYRATRLQSYTPTRIAEQRGACNGTSQHSWSLLLFSPEKFLNLILIRPDINATACGYADIGELAIVDY